MLKRILVIGVNTLGVDVAVTARKIDRKAENTLLTKDNISAYSGLKT